MFKMGNDDFILLFNYWSKVVMIFLSKKTQCIHSLKDYINEFIFAILYKKLMNNKYFMDNMFNLRLFGLRCLWDRVENASSMLHVRNIC
jgi:hypothetical protein